MSDVELLNTKCICREPQCQFIANVRTRGFSISPAGFLLVYELGVVSTLLDSGCISDVTPLAGSSAGALLSVLIGIGTKTRVILRALYMISDRCRESGTRGNLKDELIALMDCGIIDESSVIRLNSRPAPVTVGYTKISKLRMSGEYVSKFESASDLKDILVASCNIPFYTTNSFRVKVRDHKGIDGFFSTSMSRFGCPPTQAVRSDEPDKDASCIQSRSSKESEEFLRTSNDVLIIPFNLSDIRSLQYIPVSENRVISPHLRELENTLNDEEAKQLSDFRLSLIPISRKYAKVEEPEIPKVPILKRISRRTRTGGRRVTYDSTESGSEADDVYQPNLSASEDNYRSSIESDMVHEIEIKDDIENRRKMLKAALRPPSDRTIQRLFRHGQVDAYLWMLMEHNNNRKLDS